MNHIRFTQLLILAILLVSVAQGQTKLTVAADGTGNFTTVQAAVNACPSTGCVISIKAGTYKQQVTINKPFIQLRGLGSDPSKVVLTFNLDAGHAGGTAASASTTITKSAHDFFATNVTFENSAWIGKPLGSGAQAVALAVSADRAAFKNCHFLGAQDTLLADHQGCSSNTSCVTARQYFGHCFIEGNIDFIFGDAKAVFDTCEIHAVPNTVGNLDTITAQSKLYQGENSGYVFQSCTITAASGTNNVWLGRPWRAYSTVIYLNTFMPSQIVPAGWREWTPGTTNFLETATYAEFNSTGPGANPSQRDDGVQLNSTQAAQYATQTYLAGSDGWNPLSLN